MRLARKLIPPTAILLLLLGGWAFWWEPRSLIVRSDQVALPCWAPPPVRIAVASDLHVGSPGWGGPQLEDLVGRINAARPDLVVLLGDYVIQGVAGGTFVPPEVIARHLAGLRAPLGVHAVLGNHDWWLDPVRVTRAFESAGIRVLDDAAVPLRSGADRFWLIGISDFWEGRHDVRRALAGVDDAAPAIAITHNPDIFPEIPARVCLTLAGHTHGGQVALPLVGRPKVPSNHGQRYASGHVEEEGRRLFVTTGVGTSILPVRFRVPPEVVILQVGPVARRHP